MLIFLILVLGGALGLGAWYWSKRQARTRLLAAPLTADQRAIIAAQVPLLQKLPESLRAPLEGKINLFLRQISFVGCDGLEVTDEMRLSIAAQACLLVVNNDAWYSNLRTILVYPGAFRSVRKERHGYVVTERKTVRTGESWPRGPVILSWADSRQGAMHDADGHNVVLHEFAHQLDDLSGQTDGAPVLARGQSFDEWRRVFVGAFKRHVDNVENGRKTVIDAYGAEGIQEFFAVTVEEFFERPHALQRAEPEVYAQLSELFRLDPARWHRPP